MGKKKHSIKGNGFKIKYSNCVNYLYGSLKISTFIQDNKNVEMSINLNGGQYNEYFWMGLALNVTKKMKRQDGNEIEPLFTLNELEMSFPYYFQYKQMFNFKHCLHDCLYAGIKEEIIKDKDYDFSSGVYIHRLKEKADKVKYENIMHETIEDFFTIAYFLEEHADLYKKIIFTNKFNIHGL